MEDDVFGENDFTIEGWLHIPILRKSDDVVYYKDGKLWDPRQLDLFEQEVEQ